MPHYALELSAEERERYRRQAEATQDRERTLWERAGIGPGATVLDLGCGPGATLTLLAPLVGSTGTLVGLDQDADAVQTAVEQLADSAAGTVRVLHGEAPNEHPELAPASFDVVFLRHVLGHNGGQESGLVAFASGLARPGGTVYLVDTDLTMMRIVPPSAPVSELYARYDQWRVARGDDPQIGVKLGDLITEAGLELEHYEGTCGIMPRRAGARGPVWAARQSLIASGHATATDVDRWAQEFDELDATDSQPRYFITGFTAIGRRPDRST